MEYKELFLSDAAGKKRFIDAISEAMMCGRFGAVKTEYQVFYSKIDDYYQEFLVITYKSGAIAVRNCNGNSDSANMQEIARMVDGGYYQEVEGYNKINKDPEWERII